jgi:CelD/BcsL family acetyltransferase involved in cellulose biosynthesis
MPGPPAATDYDVRTLRNPQELDAIAPAWDGLVIAGRRTGPFLLAGWIATRMRAEPGRRYAIATAWRGDQLIAGFATVIGRRSGLAVAQAIGGLDDYFQDLLYLSGEEAAAGGVLDAVRSERIDAVDYYGFGADSALAEIAGPGLVCHPRSTVLQAEMPDGYDAFVARKLSSKSRNGLRRKARHLDELGGFSLQGIREPDELMATLPELFRLHDARWHDRHEDRSAFGDVRRRDFQYAALQRMAADGYARMVIARVGSEPIAFSYWFAVGDKMFSYRLAFDPQGPHARYSPGLLTFLEACRLAAEEGVRTVEFGRGVEEYKERLHDHRGSLYEGVGLPASLRGRAGVAALNAVHSARRAVDEQPWARRTAVRLRRELRRGRTRLSSSGD